MRQIPRYIHELPDWPDFRWDRERIASRLAAVRHRQGRLIGRMEALGFPLRTEAIFQTLTEDVLNTSEIEGEILDRQQVRSSIARRLGLEVGGLVRADRETDGLVEMMLDATQGYDRPLTAHRLFGWHASMFPVMQAPSRLLRIGAWRDDATGPMQVVSGPLGRQRVHFEAPEAARLPREMEAFLRWVEAPPPIDPVLAAAVAHLWFVTIHPFDDGNGRIARAIADMMLSRSEKTSQRFYSMSSQIRAERKTYYEILEATQGPDLDISAWLTWFLGCLDRAFDGAEAVLSNVLRKSRFWARPSTAGLNRRQRHMIDRLMTDFVGKLTSSKWAKLEKCSQDTALRDIDDLIARNILAREPGGGRSTSYRLLEQ